MDRTEHLRLLQIAYCLVVVGAFLVVAVTDPKMALAAVFGIAAIFGTYVALEKIFGDKK